MKKIFYYLLPITISCYSTIFGMNYGQAIVDKAKDVLGKPYHSRYPPNTWPCSAGHFDFTSWTVNDGFDCSGLVSWAAGLGRRYVTSDLISETYSTKIT